MQPDLSNLDVRKTAGTAAVCVLNHPVTEEPLTNEDNTVWSLSLISSDSDEYRKLQRRLVDKRMKEAMRLGGRPKASAAQSDSDALDLLVTCTKGWEGIIEQGKAVEFSSGAARDLYERFPWIREQASSFFNDRTNFLGNS